jgi:hypothetical protein
MAIERHQELIMDYAGKTGKENFLFVFISGGIGGCRYICSRSGRKKVQNIKRGNSQLENEHSSIFLAGKGKEQHSSQTHQDTSRGLKLFPQSTTKGWSSQT